MKYVLLRYLWLGFVCISCSGEPRIELNAKSKEAFGTLPGKIGVTIRTYPRPWYLLIDKGSLSQVSSLAAAPTEAQYSSVEAVKGAPNLTEPHGYIYGGPFLVSPNRNFIVASIESKAALAPLPTAFVVVDWRTKNVISQVKLTEGNTVNGFAWSPDSRWIAVLKSKAWFKWWLPSTILSFLVGHPATYIDISLDVVDLQGGVVAQTTLMEGLMGVSAEVIWTQ
jgi:hypothetical protein